MSDGWGLLGLGVAVGLIGSFLVVRSTRGLRTVLGCLVWLAIPFVVLAFILVAESDASLSADRASYNFSFGFVLISLIIAVPWFLSNVLGGFLGLLLRKSKPSEAPVVPVATAGPADEGLPDWSQADNPSLSLAELGEMMYAAADLAGVDHSRLPHVGPIAGGDGEWIDRDKFDYIYIGVERGQPMFDHRTVVADQLLYWVLRDAAFSLAANRLAERRSAGERIPDEEYANRLAIEQAAILGDIDPAWANQFAWERARKAGG